jgi:two-component system LytT family sensor kinase
MASITTRPRLYWQLQLVSWSLYGLFGGVLVTIFGRFSVYIIPVEVFVTVTLIGLSHLLRQYVRRHGWVRLPVLALLPRLLGAHLLIAILSQVIIGLLVMLLFSLLPHPPRGSMPWTQYLGYALNTFFVMWLWSASTSACTISTTYKQADIDKWKLTAAVQRSGDARPSRPR